MNTPFDLVHKDQLPSTLSRVRRWSFDSGDNIP